jgi:ATP-dependent Lhr-like helicase
MVFELFCEKLQKVIRERGWKEPTLPQKEAIPRILEGKNVLLIGPTGYGKTEAALLPIFDRLVREKPKPITLLYITPLKSLNRDLLERIIWWASKLNFGVTVRHGDTSQYERKLQVEHPDEMFIITPEQLQAMLVGKKIRRHLENVRFIVIDELHELIENKRGVQLAIALERLKRLCGKFQLISLSATIGSPQKAANFIGCEEIIEVKAEKDYEIRVDYITPKKVDRELAERIFIDSNAAARLRKIYEIANSHRSTLIFTNTRETAEILSSRLRLLNKEFPQEVHHSSLSKEMRIQAEKKFKEEKLKALIATSSLELGIDIGAIECVIQYLSPRQVTKLTQRIGRSGHRIGKASLGWIICNEGDDLFEAAVIAKFCLEKKLEELNPYLLALDVLVHQIIGLNMEGYESIKEIYEVIKSCYAYKMLDEKTFHELLKFLQEIKMIWINGTRIKRRRKGLLYYFENLSTIPDVYQFKVVDITTKTVIGNLDESFIAEHGEPGTTFIVKGEAWKVVGIEKNKVFAERVEDIESAIPAWEGELIPVPFEVASEVGKLRRKILERLESSKEEAMNFLLSEFPLSREAAKKMIELVKRQASYALPDEKSIVIERWEDYVIVHACFGSKVNETLARWISTILSAEYGESIAVRSDAYRIVVKGALVEDIKKVLFEYSSEDLEKLLELSLPRTSLFKYRFIHVAKRFGVIRKDARYEKINIDKLIDIYRESPVFYETLREISHDKFDLEKTKQILKDLQKGKFKLVEIEGLSPLAKEALHAFLDITKPERAERAIFDLFKKRLFDTKVRLVCMNCGKYTITKKVKDLPDEPFCTLCGSKLLGVTKAHDTEALKTIKKYLKGKTLNDSESKKLERIKWCAELVIVYGKKACIALAARGIGPQTAMRILAKMHANEENFLKDIYKAEKQFIKTRKFWS